jgi:hypothetical protein
MCGALAGGAGAYVRAVRAFLLPVVVQGRRPGNKSIILARLRRPPDVRVDPAPMRRLLRKPCGAHSESRLRVRRRFLDAVTAYAVSRARFTRRRRMSRSESFSPACFLRLAGWPSLRATASLRAHAGTRRLCAARGATPCRFCTSRGARYHSAEFTYRT